MMYDRDECREREREERERERERERGKSVLAARHDDEDDDKSPYRIHSVHKQTSGYRLTLRLKQNFSFD